MLKRLTVLFVLAALLVGMLSVVSAQDAAGKVGPITQRLLHRKKLICRVSTGTPGFTVINSDGSYSGFDVDYCRVVAAAVLGDSTLVDFRPLQADQRQAAIQSEEIDVMSRNTTYTLSRDSV